MSEQADIVAHIRETVRSRAKVCGLNPEVYPEWALADEIERLRVAVASAEAAALERAAQLIRRYVNTALSGGGNGDLVTLQTIEAAIRSLIPSVQSPAPSGEAEVTKLKAVIVELNGHLDDYWNGDKSDVTVKAICAAQVKCRAALSTPSHDSESGNG